MRVVFSFWGILIDRDGVLSICLDYILTKRGFFDRI